MNKDTFESEELRDDRQIADLRHGQQQTGGDIGFELSFAEYDDLLAGALFGDWASDTLKVGTAVHSYSFRRRYNDIGVEGLFRGCMVNNFSLSVPANNIVTGSFGIVGADGEYVDSPTEATIVPSETYDAFDSFTGEISEGGTPIAIVTSLDLTLTNNIDPAFVVGSAISPRMNPGKSNLTGTVSAYFQDKSLIQKFIDETISSISFTLERVADTTVSYTFTIPKLKYTGGDNPADGDGSIMLDLPFQALYDDVEDTNLKIDRLITT
jgi:hypothetical protein